jgi:sortase A
MGVGIALLIGSGVLIYPYLSSRLARLPAPAAPLPPPAPTPTISFLPLIEPPTEPAVDVEGTTNAPAAPPTEASVPAAPTPTPALPTRIVIPAIEVDAPVIDVSLEPVEVEGQVQSVWVVPDEYAAGWHDTSAPLGVPGNTVLNGHNTTNGEVFRELYTLKGGEAVTVYAGDVPYTYTISEILILPEAGQPLEVRLENARYILPTGDERLTLVTCHPYGSLRYRLIAVAYPTQPS